ncbi:MAG TPA: hypothetical protein VEB03_00205 [Candidatus Nanoarchaeia archaeon]|nr:hypothetical protein [Candidatus Nanoarchaeia archaeon]
MIQSPRWKPFVGEWNRSYVPVRGLGYSAFIHAALLLASASLQFAPLPHVTAHTPAETIASAADISYLPAVGGGSPGETAGSTGIEGLRAPTVPSTKRGEALRGPQHIRSAPPHPDNSLQTILRPDESNLPRIKVPLQIPSSIRVAQKQREVHAPEIKLRPSLKSVSLPTETAKPVLRARAEVVASPTDTLLAAPKIPVPLPSEVAPQEPVREPIVVAREAAGPRFAAAPVLTAASAADQQSLAVINAIQINAQPQLVPRGEKAGLFEVSPEGTGSVPGKSPGAPSGNDDTLAARTRQGGAGKGTSGEGGPAARGSGDRGSGPGSGLARSGSGSGDRGTGPGNAGSKGTGTKGARGNGEGGSGTGNGPGTGPGGGIGPGPFPGISVAAGPRPGAMMVPPSSAKASRVNSYDLTIVGAAGSGGLKDFGIFRNEAVYTVYFDASDIGGGPASWTLQYAVLADGRNRRQTSITLGASDTAEAMLEPPFPLQKTVPESAATGFGHNGTVVVTAVLSREGRLESIRALQSPNKDRTDSVIAALAQWVFRPGKRAGEAMPLKVVMGVPVSW